MDKIGEQQIRELKDVVTILQQIDGQLFFDEICCIQAKISNIETNLRIVNKNKPKRRFKELTYGNSADKYWIIYNIKGSQELATRIHTPEQLEKKLKEFESLYPNTIVLDITKSIANELVSSAEL